MPSQGQVHRRLGRPSGHRRAMLRNLVTSLLKHDSITTTHARAKEAQPIVEKLITAAKTLVPAEQVAESASPAFAPAKLAKYNATHRIYGTVFDPKSTIKRLMTVVAPRYISRTGGYTRVLHLEPRSWDSAKMSVLELIGGDKDLRLYITARAIARAAAENRALDPASAKNKLKIIQSMPDGEQVLNEKVDIMTRVFYSGRAPETVLQEISDSAAAKEFRSPSS
ncbi:mitochondrial 54S ribosomal protein bL17m [Lipomyces oligophaga]|uniref:mitochondrial 54S ribosomal protein bL17m n=1 Tax=Lipomyces oligophaga TaxID=45792 RepID=UPI0034CD7ED7